MSDSDEPTKPPKQEGPARPSASGPRELAQYLAQLWIPVRPGVLEMIRTKSQKGIYDSDRGLFLNDLKQDFALYSKFLRDLGPLLSEEDRVKHPLKIIRGMDSSSLRAILNSSSLAPQERSFETAEDAQASQLKFALLSTTTAELLAERSQLDPTAVVNASMLRQVGSLLIAWNYPRTFAKALAGVSNHGNNLTLSIKKYFGVSPVLLGSQLSAGWNKNPSFQVGLQPEILKDRGFTKQFGASELEELKYTAEQIAKFCALGDDVARVTEQKHYATSAREWDRVFQEVNDRLGSNALALIQKKYASAVGPFQSLSQKLSEIDISQRPVGKKGLSAYAQKAIARNTDIKKLPADLQDLVRSVYEVIEEAAVSVESLARLVSSVIPKAGFDTGCIFLANNDNTSLTPTVKVGNAELAKFSGIRAGTSGTVHPVLEALGYQVPIIQQQVHLFGHEVSHVTGAFGNRRKRGVLYLEVTPDLLGRGSAEMLTRFRVIRHCLDEALGLREVETL